VYGAAQLQGNVRMRPRRVLHAFQMRLAHVSDAFERYLKAELYRR